MRTKLRLRMLLTLLVASVGLTSVASSGPFGTPHTWSASGNTGASSTVCSATASSAFQGGGTVTYVKVNGQHIAGSKWQASGSGSSNPGCVFTGYNPPANATVEIGGTCDQSQSGNNVTAELSSSCP